MTTLARVLFAALVIATFGAFFAAQRLKNSPAVISSFTRTLYVSPNHDGFHDTAEVNFALRDSDRVSVAVVDDDGDEVRRLVSGRDAPAGVKQELVWDGRTDEGDIAPDGVYRYRLILQRQGRSAVIQKSTTLDRTAPRPRVVAMGPSTVPGPELLPQDGKEAVAHLRGVGRDGRVLLFKMAPGTPRRFATFELPKNATTWSWDGTIEGRRASPGTYLVVAETRDRAGNVGRSVKLDRRQLPAAPYGEQLGGRGGITVRYLAIFPQLTPVAPKAFVTFRVDSRTEPYTWRVRRVGSSRVLAQSGAPKTVPTLRFHAPDRPGVHLLEVRSGSRTARIPFVVQGRAREKVLVVLPAMTWQGRNPVDDGGDGLPDLLDRGLPARLERPFVGDLPVDFAERDAQVLGWLDRSDLAYDVTTDVALARGEGPRLAGHTGVLLTSDARWLPRATLQALRGFVRAGGTVASLGIDALRRQVELTEGVLRTPTAAATTDAFGARLGKVQRFDAPVTLVNASDDPQVGLFEGTTGEFAGYTALQEVEAERDVVSSATVLEPPSGNPTIAAARLGSGLVLRYPLPELPSKLAASASDPQALALLARAWMLLSR